VGQSEVEIAGIADTTVVVVVPEGGDEVQTLKSGVMEIADIFVVNKFDRPTATTFLKNLAALSHTTATNDWEIPVIKTIATQQIGIDVLLEKIDLHHSLSQKNFNRKKILLAQKVWQIVANSKMQDISQAIILEKIEQQLAIGITNAYQIASLFV
jgi:LAO/AO transport system kinase